MFFTILFSFPFISLRATHSLSFTASQKRYPFTYSTGREGFGVQGLHELLQTAKGSYDGFRDPSDEISLITCYTLDKLERMASHSYQASIGEKRYHVYSVGEIYSRPFLPTMFLSDSEQFKGVWQRLIQAINGQEFKISMPASEINNVLYTAITAFSVCYDLWKPGSRKTPGTFFEIMLGTILAATMPRFVRTKFIPIPGEIEHVSTDIVFKHPQHESGLVMPAKITTRERIVQPFAHQRILDSVFGLTAYKSLLLCVSEVQREGHVGVNEICVPGTIRLFQKHLSQLTGIYYLDPPRRYLQEDLTEHIEISSIGQLLTSRLSEIIAHQTA